MSMTDTGRKPGFALAFIVHVIAEAAALWVATKIVSGIHVYGGVFTYLWIGLLFGVINGILGSILRLFTLPLVVLTLGLFSLLISTGMLALTAALSSKLDIDGFWSAFWAAAIIAVVSAIVEWILRRAASSV